MRRQANWRQVTGKHDLIQFRSTCIVGHLVSALSRWPITKCILRSKHVLSQYLFSSSRWTGRSGRSQRLDVMTAIRYDGITCIHIRSFVSLGCKQQRCISLFYFSLTILYLYFLSHFFVGDRGSKVSIVGCSWNLQSPQNAQVLFLRVTRQRNVPGNVSEE